MFYKTLSGKVLPIALSALVMMGTAAAPLPVFAAEDTDNEEMYEEEYDDHCDDHEQWEYDDEDVIFTDIDDGGDVEEDHYSYIVTGCHDSSIYVGDTTNAYAEVFSDLCGARFDIGWSSQNNSVAQVTGNGESAYIKGVGQGSTQITATFYINNTVADTDTFTINVKARQPQRIGVTGITIESSSRFIKVGEQIGVNAAVLPRNASNQEIHYCSSNANVASVNDRGVIVGRNPGTAIITARTCENGYTAQMQVTVNGAANPNVNVSSVSVNPTSVTLAINQYIYITPSIYPAEAANRQVAWSSSNPLIATVSNNGKVQGMAPGVAVITCRTLDGNKTATTTVTVGNAVAPLVPAPAAPTAPITANVTRDPMLCYNTTLKILQAAPKATVTIDALQPMSYDANVAAALAQRPDVTLAATFPFQGHNFMMTLPPKYPLASHLDKTGYVDWLMLCALKDGVKVTVLK